MFERIIFGIRYLLLTVIRAYQRWISPLLGHRCCFYPSCSRYAEQAFSALPLTKASYLIAKRLLRCHPLSQAGIDELVVNHHGQQLPHTKR